MNFGLREIDLISHWSKQLFPGLQYINRRNKQNRKYSGVLHIPVSGRLKDDIRIAINVCF